jgi:hypothetical protein
MDHRIVSFALAVASCVVFADASGVVSSPYFEINGGVPDRQMLVGTGNFIPATAYELDSVVFNSVASPVTVILRDPGFTTGLRQVCVDYIGTDASFQNHFFVNGTTINWCNKASCQDPAAAPLGVGNQNWTGPFSASACFSMNVGQPVPFTFVADVLNQGGNGTHTVGNGEAVAGAHWGVFPYPFVFAPPFPTGSPVIGVGLSDGAYAPGDDDHQDLTVRFTVQGIPIPSLATQIPTLGQWGLMLRVLSVAALGVYSLRRVRK